MRNYGEIKMRNYVELIGNCGADPVVKKTDNGQDFASVSIATTDNYKDKNGEWVNITDWHMVVSWRHNAIKLGKAKKGSTICVIGKSKTRKYTDKNGAEKYITEVVADEVILFEKSDKKASGPEEDTGNSINTGRSSLPQMQ